MCGTKCGTASIKSVVQNRFARISKKDGDIPLAIVCELHIMIVTL